MSDKLASPYFVLCDVHAPFHQKRRVAAMLDLMRDIGCKGLILNGDFTDFPEVSRHNKGSVLKLEGQRFKRSIDGSNALLDELLAAAGTGDHHWVEGNHDMRPRTWLQQGENSVFEGDESLDVVLRLRLRERGFKVHLGYDQDARFYLGKLMVTHGRYCSKYTAARHLEQYGVSVLFGHTHTVQVYHAAAAEGQRGAFACGYMADETRPELKYVGEIKRWIPGFALVYTQPNGNFSVQLVNFVGGTDRFYYGGRVYGNGLKRCA